MSAIAGSENLHRELGTFYNIFQGLFGYACTYVCDLKGVVEWAASNRETFERDVSTSHQATSLLNDVSRLLSEYLNACVQTYCTRGLSQPGSLTSVSFEHLHDKLRFLPYHGPARLHPTLRSLIRERDVRHTADGIPTPGGSEAMRIKLAVAAEVARDSGGGSSGGGGGGDVHGYQIQCDDNADAGGSTRHGHKGIPLTNPTCIKHSLTQ